MNWYWLIAGILMIMGGLAHLVIGEKNVIKPLSNNKFQGDYSPNQSFNLLRWFWYYGGYVSLLTGVVGIIIGYTDDVIPSEKFVGQLMAWTVFGFIPTFVIVVGQNPKDIWKISQIFILAVVVVLYWIGSTV